MLTLKRCMCLVRGLPETPLQSPSAVLVAFPWITRQHFYLTEMIVAHKWFLESWLPKGTVNICPASWFSCTKGWLQALWWMGIHCGYFGTCILFWWPSQSGWLSVCGWITLVSTWVSSSLVIFWTSNSCGGQWRRAGKWWRNLRDLGSPPLAEWQEKQAVNLSFRLLSQRPKRGAIWC